MKLTTHEDINQALEYEARIYTELMKSRGMTDFQWKKAFKRQVVKFAKNQGWEEQLTHNLARQMLAHYMNEWKNRTEAMYRKGWRIYSPESSAKEYMNL